MVVGHRTLGLLVLATLTAGAGLLRARPARADCDDPFGKPNEALDFHFKIKRSDWAALVASRVPSTDGNRAACDAKYPEVPAEFRCGDAGAWLKVALRKKRGEERGVEAPQKPPLKIDINEDFLGKVPEAKGQRWPARFGDLGYRKLTLNNGQGNKPPGRMLMLPNLLSEHVALRLLHREVPASPGTAIARVTLHFEDKPEGEFHGAYVLIEDIDKAALRRRFGRADGRLVKASKAGCPNEVQFDDGPPNEAKTVYDSFIAKAGTVGAGQVLAEADKGVELDEVLRQEAIREILVNGDDTLFYGGGEGNNWYAYDPRQGKRHYMPWDVDLTFGQQQQNCAPNSLKCLPSFPLSRFCKGSRLGAVTACNAEVQKRYYQIMCQLTQGSLSADEIIKVWDQADQVARPAAALEKDLIWNGADPLSTSIDKSYGAEFVRLRAWIPERIRSVQQQLTAKGVMCAPGCPAGASEPCQYLTCAGQRRCVDNLWTVCQPNPDCVLPGAKPTPAPPAEGGPAPGTSTDAGAGAGGADAPTLAVPPGSAADAGVGAGAAPGQPGSNARDAGSTPSRPDPGSGASAPSAAPSASPPQQAGCSYAARAPGATTPALVIAFLVAGARARRRRSRERAPEKSADPSH